MKRFRLVWFDPHTFSVGQSELEIGSLTLMVMALHAAGLEVLGHPEIEGPNPGSLTPYDWDEIEWVD